MTDSDLSRREMWGNTSLYRITYMLIRLMVQQSLLGKRLSYQVHMKYKLSHTHVAAFSFQILQKQIMQIIIKNVRNRSKILALDGFQNPKFGWVPVNFSKILLLQPYMMLPLLLWCTSIFFLKASGAAVPERKMKWKRHQKSGFHSRQHFTIAVTECGFLDVICRVPWNSV